MLRVLVLLASMTLAVGCSPFGPQFLEDFDSVISAQEDGVDFSNLKTFRLGDHVLDGSNFLSDADPELESFILGHVTSQMEGQGFVLETNPAVTKPHVLVLVTVQATDFDTFVGPGYWNAWSDFPGWAWWGTFPGDDWTPRYPPGLDFAQFNSGMLHIDMIRPNPDAADHSLEVVWGAVLDGVDLPDPDSRARLQGLIEQAFEQSTYLRGDK